MLLRDFSMVLEAVWKIGAGIPFWREV